MRIALTIACLIAALPAAVQDDRLKRPIEFPDDGSIPDGAKIGNLAVDHYDRIQRTQADAYPRCRSTMTYMLGPEARRLAAKLPDAQREALKARDKAPFKALAIEVIGTFDGVDPALIRADEAIGPGVYAPAITAIAYTIERCGFY